MIIRTAEVMIAMMHDDRGVIRPVRQYIVIFMSIMPDNQIVMKIAMTIMSLLKIKVCKWYW